MIGTNRCGARGRADAKTMLRRLLWVGASAAIVAALWIGTTLREAIGTLSQIHEKVLSEGVFAVRAQPWSAVIPAGLESVGTPAAYVAAQPFQGDLFIAGPAGLTSYSSSAALKKSYRAGIELPPAPLTALTTGIAGDSPSPELWIGTAGEGLLAFDGQTFRHIRPERADHAKVTALLATATGRILVGTEKTGVLVWDGTRLTPFHASLAGVWVTALAGDDSDLWIGTLDRGVLHWQGGSLQLVQGSLPDVRVFSLAISQEHTYAGTALGVADIESNNVRRVLASGYFAQALLVDNEKLYVGTLEEGTVEVLLRARTGHVAADSTRNCDGCNVRQILRMGDDLYTLTAESLWKGQDRLLSPEAATLKDRNISALSKDSAGRLWIGYFDRGLQVLGANGARVADFEDDHLFCINRIVPQPGTDVTAVGTANGLVLIDGVRPARRVLTQANGLIASQITDVAFRADRTLIAATPAGVSFVDSTGVQSLYAFQGLVNNHVFALAADGDRVLAGTLGGLSVLESGLVKASYTTANSSLGHNWITAVQRVENDYFIGTYGAGVMKWSVAGTWEGFEDIPRGLEVNTNAMSTSLRAVYAGTLDRGLAIYNRASARWHFLSAGLPSRNVTAVEARGGTIWIGTDNGLVRVPEESILP